jgi:prevent-host-death family protein
MEKIVNIHEAKTHLSRLLERVRRGEGVTIAKAGRPIARLVPFGDAPSGGRVHEPSAAAAPPWANRAERLRRFLEDEVWPVLPPGEAGRRLTRDEEDRILGYGPAGV